MRTTREPQNQSQYEDFRRKGAVRLGVWTSHIWRSDPRHLGFLLARYKFCAKMLAGKGRVLEVGCGDAIGFPVMLQTARRVYGIDVEPLVVEEARARLKAEGLTGWSLSVLDITKNAPEGTYDGAYSLDVIEHIPPKSEARFMKNLCGVLRPHGICIIGTPSLSAQGHASPASRAGHINLKDSDTLSRLLSSWFHNVLIFSMNDEVVHTGFYPMAHYLLGMGIGVRR